MCYSAGEGYFGGDGGGDGGEDLDDDDGDDAAAAAAHDDDDGDAAVALWHILPCDRVCCSLTCSFFRRLPVLPARSVNNGENSARNCALHLCCIQGSYSR